MTVWQLASPTVASKTFTSNINKAPMHWDWQGTLRQMAGGGRVLNVVSKKWEFTIEVGHMLDSEFVDLFTVLNSQGPYTLIWWEVWPPTGAAGSTATYTVLPDPAKFGDFTRHYAGGQVKTGIKLSFFQQ